MPDLTPSRLRTLSLYLTSITFEPRIFIFSPEQSNCRQIDFSKNSDVFNSRNSSLLAVAGGLDGHI